MRNLFSAVPLLIAILPSLAAANPFPGYGGGALFRFDNGAVGEITAIGGGSADVDVYDGSTVSNHNVPFDRATPLPSPLSVEQVRLLSADDNTGTVREVIATPNFCLDGAGNPASSNMTIRGCDMTLLDLCVTRSDPLRQNAPCMLSVSPDSITLQVWEVLEEGDPRQGVCPMSTADGEPACTDRTTANRVIALPDTSIVPFPHQAGYDDALFDWIEDCVTTGSVVGNCEAFDPTIFDNAPDEEQSTTVSAPGALPVNEPIPSPVPGVPGEDMNPGGHVGGGSGDTGGFSSGSGSSGGGTGSDTGGGGSDTGDGGGSSDTEGEGDEITTDDEGTPLDNDTRSVGSFNTNGQWLPRSCPTFPPVNFFGESYDLIDMTAVCGAAPMIRGFVMAMAALMSLHIVFSGFKV